MSSPLLPEVKYCTIQLYRNTLKTPEKFYTMTSKLPSTLIFLILLNLLHAHPLGPGNLKWKLEIPEILGLHSKPFTTAAQKVEQIKIRYCLLIIKNGTLISETYYHNNTDTTYETDSAAKTMLGLLIGAVWTQHRWDLDAPLSSFGVNTSIFNEWKDVVTSRHVLTQASGKGVIAPGTGMTYDSDQYIQTLSPLLNKILEPENITILDWAEKHFAQPLGISGVFAADVYIGGGNISIGGGQRMTCRQLGRIGQLMLNNGTWLNGKKEIVLVDPLFVAQMKQPSFPNAFTTYGFLTWLNKRGTSPSFCCAPRWCSNIDRKGGNLWGGFSGTSLHGIIGDDISYGYGPSADYPSGNLGPVIQAPEDAMIALGYLGRLLLMFPLSDTVVVTMGQTGSQTLLGGGCDYDEGYALSLIYKAIEPLLITKTNVTLAQNTLKKWNQPQQNIKTAVLPVAIPQKETVNKSSPVIGSCFCFCPPGEGYGQCFDVYKEDQIIVVENEDDRDVVDPCSKFKTLFTSCPSIGVAQQCSTNETGALLPSPTCANGSSDWDNTECNVVAECPDRNGAPANPFDTEFCECQPISWDSCYFVPSSTNCGDGKEKFKRSSFEKGKKQKVVF